MQPGGKKPENDDKQWNPAEAAAFPGGGDLGEQQPDDPDEQTDLVPVGGEVGRRVAPRHHSGQAEQHDEVDVRNEPADELQHGHVPELVVER